MRTRQWQCGARSAGTRGGRWIGRIWARGIGGDARWRRRWGPRSAWHMPTHPFLAHRLDVHQRAAVRQPELAAAVVDARRKRKSRTPCGAPTSNCMPLKMVATSSPPTKPSVLLHAPRVDRAGAHPLVDGDLPHRLATPAQPHLRHAGAVLQVAGELVLARQHGEGAARQARQREVGVEGAERLHRWRWLAHDRRGRARIRPPPPRPRTRGRAARCTTPRPAAQPGRPRVARARQGPACKTRRCAYAPPPGPARSVEPRQPPITRDARRSGFPARPAPRRRRHLRHPASGCRSAA